MKSDAIVRSARNLNLQRPAEMSGPSKEVTEMDCTPEFIGAMAGAIYVGTYHQVRLETPLEWMAKRDVVLRGAELGVPFAITHSCYEGLRPACGKCPTCVERLAAFEAAGLIDPLEYAEGSDQRGDW